MAAVRRRIRSLRSLVGKDPVLAIATVLALASCAAVPPDAGYADYVDLHTIGLLFSLMAAMTGLSRAGVFRVACRHLLAAIRGTRPLILALTLLAFFSSMFITNDVALVTFVPLALLALDSLRSPKLTCFTVVMMTIAANVGSMLTPVGNPQNLYLYSASGMPLPDFILLVAPYAAAALVMLAIVIVVAGRALKRDGIEELADARRGRAPVTATAEPDALAPARIVPWVAVFAVSLLAVAHVVPVGFPVAVALLVGVATDRGALAHVDYGLLVTFVAFFVFVGNMGRIEAVDAFIASVVAGHELIVSVVASQVLSNVPTAILLSGFTSDLSALIVGTNIGGLGTLIASMASLISYKQLALWLPAHKGRYLVMFTAWNVAFLVVLLALALL